MSDQLGAIKRIMKANNINEEVLPARKIQNYINKQKKKKEFEPRILNLTASAKETCLESMKFTKKVINREGAVDFGELILRTYEMLLNNEPIRQHYYQDRFKFILVDEFQDTNKLRVQISQTVGWSRRRRQKT